MPFTLDNVAPWGRSLDEYTAMFALSRRDLESRLLGCADGPASFNAEVHDRGGSVISVCPIYYVPRIWRGEGPRPKEEPFLT